MFQNGFLQVSDEVFAGFDEVFFWFHGSFRVVSVSFRMVFEGVFIGFRRDLEGVLAGFRRGFSVRWSFSARF